MLNAKVYIWLYLQSAVLKMEWAHLQSLFYAESFPLKHCKKTSAGLQDAQSCIETVRDTKQLLWQPGALGIGHIHSSLIRGCLDSSSKLDSAIYKEVVSWCLELSTVVITIDSNCRVNKIRSSPPSLFTRRHLGNRDEPSLFIPVVLFLGVPWNLVIGAKAVD